MSNENLTNNEAVIIPDDGAREASIGQVAALPTLGETLRQWEAQIVREHPTDEPTAMKALFLRPNGRLARSEKGGDLRMTYRVYGGLLRDYTAPPKNIARCLHRLSVAARDTEKESPASMAYNDYLQKGRAANGEKEVWLRTRRLPNASAKGGRETVIVGQVTPSHSRAGSDDIVFIEKLKESFAGELHAIRATYYRGIEVSELRAVIPHMRVETAPGEWWSAYVNVRNSEVGAASWSVSAGLYKEMDEETADAARRLGFEGATLSIEANERVGVHSGKKVAQRVEEGLESANALLQTLKERAATLSAVASSKSAEWIVNRLATALRRVGGGDDMQDHLLGALAMQANEWERRGMANPGVEAHEIVTFLGQIMVQLKRRGQTYPLERLAGRVLMHGIDAALDKLPEYSDVEENE